MSWNLIVATMLATVPAAPAAPAEPPRPLPAAVEISFATHAGEGASGRKRFTRDGCYQVESGGGTGGAGYARDSQAGCHRPSDVAAVFARLAAMRGDALEREKPARGSATGGAPARDLGPGGSETQVVIIRADGSRWVAANKPADDDLLRAINELPSENQWYAPPPEKPIGAGAQLLTLAVAASGRGGSWRVEASLASDGRWWCHRSVIGDRGGEHKLPAKKAPPLTDTRARLDRILAGARPDPGDEGQTAPDKRADKSEISVQVAWPGQERGPLRPRRLADSVADRFGGEMRALSPACATTSERVR